MVIQGTVQELGGGIHGDMGYGTEKRSWEEGYMVIWGTVQRRGVGRRDTW
jgi:hypothetical protein